MTVHCIELLRNFFRKRCLRACISCLACLTVEIRPGRDHVSKGGASHANTLHYLLVGQVFLRMAYMLCPVAGSKDDAAHPIHNGREVSSTFCPTCFPGDSAFASCRCLRVEATGIAPNAGQLRLFQSVVTSFVVTLQSVQKRMLPTVNARGALWIPCNTTPEAEAVYTPHIARHCSVPHIFPGKALDEQLSVNVLWRPGTPAAPATLKIGTSQADLISTSGNLRPVLTA